jgi:hypothetical protein
VKIVRKNAFLIVAGLALVLAGISALAATNYFQGFETDTYDWSGATRVPTGTNFVPSAAGIFHAQVANGAFTRFGGYEATFPAGGYTTSVDVYLNVGAGNTNDTRFDWSSAISTPAAGFRRDFVFNAGFYLDSDTTGTGPRFVISASNNATRSSAFPKNPTRDPFTITQTGWYTFTHHFRNNGSGVLAVDLSISKLGILLHTWTLSDPSDVIGSTVGGHRYGWFVIQEFPVLAIDNVSLVSFPDSDGDGIADNVDNCPTTPNPGQEDADLDGVGDLCDNCPTVINTNQADADGDNLGDACDTCPLDATNDADGDGVCDNVDACPGTPIGTVVNSFGCPLAETKDQCKNGGWQTLRRANNTTFKNQGDCIQYANTGK